MKQLAGGSKRIVLLFAFLLTAPVPGGAHAQRPGHRFEAQDAFLKAKVPEFRMHNQTLLDGLEELARGPAPFGFGFEDVLAGTVNSPAIPKRLLSLRLKDRSVGQVLDAICQADARFTWSTDGAFVNVYPRAVVGDPSYLLNRRIENFVLRNATDVQDGLLAIHRELPPPPEQVAILQVGGGDPYPPKPWTVTYKNLTVRQIVNRLAAHGGTCAIWLFAGSMDFRHFAFFNTYLCSKRPAPDSARTVIGPRRSP